MQLPLQIMFRNFEPSDAIEARIRQRVEKLSKFYNRITNCRVIVEVPHQHHHKGKLYHVQIDLTMPNGQLVINRNPEQHQPHEDTEVAMRDAFAAAERKLKDYADIHRHEVKVHEMSPHGRVINLLPEDDYGFIETPDGREIYFHANSVLNGGFRDLQVGSSVRFVEELGEKGPQASSVRAIGKHPLPD
ncbi:HPF/RaiA family ribosome-associated protein [Leptothermofonsia sp. ETS-13]|uniref:HPF/RaiA family ribosome-associated protein n=1 Tax=Leptothermofonsia sp. ETS-13 TaxID=3035696 RepID=UPI003BA30D8D